MTARPGRRAASAAALALLMLLQAWSLWRAPAAWYPAEITVSLAAGDSIALGRHELAAAQAERSHVGLRRDAAGAWWLRNLSAGKHLLLQTADGERRMGSAALRARHSFRLGAARFEVETAGADALAFAGAGRHWRYDGAVLYRDGDAQAPCPDAGVAARALALWNRAVPAALTSGRALTFGGNLHCGNRLGLADVTPGAAVLARRDGQWQLSAGNPDGARAALALSADGVDVELRRQEQPLSGVQAIVVGHTRFQLRQQDGQLHLLPSRRVALFSAPEQKLAPALRWQWRQRPLWDGAAQGPLWSALALAALAAALTARRGAAWQWRGAAAAATLVLLAGIAALALQRAGHAPAPACSMALGGAALWLWLALPGRLPLAGAAAVLLLAAGLLAQLELGLGGMESSWLRYYQKSAALLAIGAGLGGLWRLWNLRHPGVAGQRGVEWALAALALAALAALAMQVLWGDETGVFDVQPVELAKLALTALTAHCLALRLGWHSVDRHRASRRARWLRLIAPVLLFLALLGMALVEVDDYSPLILLLVWCTAMAFAYALAARNGRLAVAVAALALGAAGAVACLHGADPARLPLAGGFYADRFLVWLEPARHPHTGQQLLLGARAIGDGGWWGADHFLGLAGLGQNAGSAVLIPAVQDDFAPAFFLNRHGLAGALLLWGLQAAFVVGLLQTARRGHAAGAAARDHRLAWQGRFRYFALCGGAAFVLGHLLLSWGTNLAILPIMGQPMSFLSAGGSHLLLFLCPLLTFCAASALSLEENPSCRSMSSTKS
ncbi:FtsW/RodA/SpoVE family cell cycle protein [Janthinobacterium fluminis]|uniref:Probable peptidoglycan glycosyltransferase FtsW n=1 Tax=Janthinobacterium fluminis TaxID=2987524 RepID=A0ABT5K4J6_9BURK|nr:FtsW/RodA/SpoVE family cell cycle protein [Janthinobacterium fluminis]MDC8759931.1 FtsW/RodA/SpoVE family cell cycle protein [Janthinobacterium fluminis]